MVCTGNLTFILNIFNYFSNFILGRENVLVTNVDTKVNKLIKKLKINFLI